MLNWSFFIFFVTDDASSNLHLSFKMSLNLKHFPVLKIFFYVGRPVIVTPNYDKLMQQVLKVIWEERVAKAPLALMIGSRSTLARQAVNVEHYVTLYAESQSVCRLCLWVLMASAHSCCLNSLKFRMITVTFVYILHQPPLQSWTWLSHKKANLTQNSTM